MKTSKNKQLMLPQLDEGRLMRRIFWRCTAALLLGTGMLMAVNNILIHGQSFANLWEFSLRVVLISDIFIIALLMAVAHYRLRPVRHFLRTPFDEVKARATLERLYQFPTEMLMGLLAVTIVFSSLFHILDSIKYGFQLWPTVESMASEWILGLTLGLLLFSFMRSSLRPIIMQIQQHVAFSSGFQGKSTMMNTFMFTFFSCQLILHYNMIRYVMKKLSQDSLPQWGMLFAIAGIYFLFGLLILLQQSIDFRRELRMMIRSLQGMFSRGDQRTALPVLFKDELGQFAASVNEFGEHLQAEYEQLQQEFQLASHVQQTMLPQLNIVVGDWRIATHFRPSRVLSGDLYDVVKIDEDRFAVMNGDVSGKGLPAAVLMSAIIVLFRSEVASGGSADDILTRLNQHVTDTVRGEMFVTLGLALIHVGDGTVQYASAGHMAPYLLTRTGDVKQLELSSLPLGIDRDTTYQGKGTTFTLEKGERLVLYTDGIVEAMDDRMQMFGFERWEHVLATVTPQADPDAQLGEMLAGLRQSNITAHISATESEDCTHRLNNRHLHNERTTSEPIGYTHSSQHFPTYEFDPSNEINDDDWTIVVLGRI